MNNEQSAQAPEPCKPLNRKQLAVIDDLFTGQFDEQAILKRRNVTMQTYRKWLADDRFAQEFDRRIAWLARQTQAIIAKYAALAAAKLVELTGSDKEETARKACLDIISMPIGGKADSSPADPQTAGIQQPQISQTTASRLLAVLADTKEAQ